MTAYKIVEDYRENDFLRNEFFHFTRNVFGGLDFKEWYVRGFWTDSYIPYSIVKKNTIISNVSISKMRILIDGKEFRGLQIGTVATLGEYRKQGLSRELMEFVIEKHKDSATLFFLFANESVVNFYPKFGFRNVKEVIFKDNLSNIRSKFSGRKLDIHNESDFLIIKQLLSKRAVLTKLFGALDYTIYYVLAYLEHISAEYYLS